MREEQNDQRRLDAVHGPVEALGVVVGIQDRRQGDESGAGREPAPRAPAHRCEERRVHEQIELGVEVAAENGDAAGEAGELAVGVVEQRLELDEPRREHEGATRKLDRPRKSGDPGRDDDDGGRHAQPREDEHERVGERPEDRLAHDLVAVPPLPRARERVRLQTCPRRSG